MVRRDRGALSLQGCANLRIGGRGGFAELENFELAEVLAQPLLVGRPMSGLADPVAEFTQRDDRDAGTSLCLEHAP